MEKYKTALFIGRLQPPHLGHITAIKDALKQSGTLIIGIGSSQCSNTKENPFSFEERKEMIQATLQKENIPENKYKIIPIPDINNDDKWVEHVEKLCGKVDPVYSANPHTIKLFKEKGHKIKKVKIKHIISATEIRKKINENAPLKGLVPDIVEEIIKKKIKG